jgi:hypothetical protein
MKSHEPTLRQAALVAGVGYVLTLGTAVSEMGLLPRMVVEGDAAQTTENILAHPGTFHAAVLLLLVNFVGDLLATWGLYYLLKPVSASLSLLAAWARLVYTAVGIAALLNLVSVRTLLKTPSYATLLGGDQLHAHVKLAVDSFEYQFGFSMLLFGPYLVLLGCLLWRSGYVPKWLGIVILVDGAGWIVNRVGSYFAPGVDLGFLSVTFYGELVFMLWLLVRGWRLKEG